MNRAEEDYLKAILELSQYDQEPVVKVSDIASRFGYTEQSVYEMMRKLQDIGQVVYTPYKGIELTNEGNIEAIRLIRAHRIWEVFLTKELGYNWQEVHEEAEQLEHASSEELLERMYLHLGEPATCQHGNPIPNFTNEYQIPKDTALVQSKSGGTFIIERVVDDVALLSFLDKHHMKIGDQLEVGSYDALNDNLHVVHQGQALYLGSKLTSMIYGRQR